MPDRRGIADYELVRPLGEGSFGETYLAKRPKRVPVDDEFLAVKVFTGRTTDDSFRRATRQLRIFATVGSPHLVRLFDAGQDGGNFYYAMEYLPLGSLASPARPLEHDHVLRAVADAARAAHALHEAGYVHQDIKPANVLLVDDGGRLSDLGLAQILNPGQTVTSMGALGSVEFMDPAIMRGERASRASDIWSLGMTLHRALSGVGVYGELPERDPLLAIRTVLNTEPAVSATLAPTEAAVVRACLDPDPAARPATGALLAARIDALVTS